MRKNVYQAMRFLTVLIGMVCLSLPVCAGSFGSSAAGSGKTISASSSGSSGGSWGKVNIQAKPSLSEKKSAPNMKAVTVSSSSVNIDFSVQGLVDDFNWAKDAIFGSGKPVQGQSVSVVNPRIGSDLDGWSLTYPEQTLPENMQMFTANNVQLKSQASAGDIKIKNQGGTEGWVSRSDVWAYVVTSAGARTGNGEGGDGKYALVRTDNIGVGKESQLFIPSRGAYREDNNNKVDSRSTTQYRTMTANPSGTGDILTVSYKDAFVVGKVDINSDGGVKTLNSVLVREDKMNSGGDFTRVVSFDSASPWYGGGISFETVKSRASVPAIDIFVKVDAGGSSALVRPNDLSLISSEDKTAVTNNGNTYYTASRNLITEDSSFYGAYGFPPLDIIN